MDELISKLQRENNSHKGENGKVGVISGSQDFSGAPALNANGALRTGADLVKIFTSAEVENVVRSYSENFIVDSYDSGYFNQESVKKAEKISEWADAVAVGSGLSKPDAQALEKFAENSKTPLVVDADAVGILCEADFTKAVFTPHEAEAKVIKDKFGSIENFVQQKNAVVVVTGEKDRVYMEDNIVENDTGHPTMTAGGTGDVLAGIIASLIAQGLEIDEAVTLGTWTNGKAGENSAEKYGNSALATDMIKEIPYLLK